MIVYHGRFGNRLGQADAVPPNAPLVRAPERVDPQPLPVIVENVETPDPAAGPRAGLSKTMLTVGGLAVALFAVTLWSSTRK